MAARPSAAQSREEGIVLTRILDAPRERVWRAWTEPARLKRWWAPKDCTTPHCTVDLRPGGAFHYCIRMPDGQDVWGLGVYREVVEPERLVYTDSFADAQGNPVPPSEYRMGAEHPAEALVTVTFEDLAGKTRLTLRHAVPAKFAERQGVETGWGEMLDRLSAEMARKP